MTVGPLRLGCFLTTRRGRFHGLAASCRSSVVRAWYASVVFGEVAWDEASEAHLARHAITPDEVEDVLFCRPRLV